MRLVDKNWEASWSKGRFAEDMDGWDLDGNSDEELSDEGKSEEEEGCDFLWERGWGLDTNSDREALMHGPINEHELQSHIFNKKNCIPHFA